MELPAVTHGLSTTRTRLNPKDGTVDPGRSRRISPYFTEESEHCSQMMDELSTSTENDGKTPFDPKWEITGPGVAEIPEEQGSEGEHEISWRVPNRKMLRDARRRYQKTKRERSRIQRRRK